jgi:hypothetical protein
MQTLHGDTLKDDYYWLREKNDPKVTVLGLGNLDPPSDATIGLHDFFDRRPNRSFDPLVTDRSSIGPAPECVEVASSLHCCKLTKSG